MYDNFSSTQHVSKRVVPTRGGGYLRVCVDGPVVDGDMLDQVEAHAGAPA